MACTYTFNGKSDYSYTELIKQLASADIDKALAILYSLKQDQSRRVNIKKNMNKKIDFL